MMMTEVRYTPKNNKCLLPPVSFYVSTEDVELARQLTIDKLRNYTKHWERYAPICMYKELIEVK
jgi:hypothetical protein